MNSGRNRSAWFALGVLFAINLMNFYDRQILAAVMEPVRKEWGFSDSAMGLLGTAFTLVYAAVGLPLGRLADNWSRTKLLGIGVAFWSVVTAASGLAWNYASLFVTRVGAGIGEASCAPAATSLIGELYPREQRARALSVFMLGLPIGLFLSYWLSGRIAHAWGWRAAFYCACVPGLVLSILVLRIREPGSVECRVSGEGESVECGVSSEGAAHKPQIPRHSTLETLALVLREPVIRWIVLSGALHNFNMYAINSFLTAFLIRYHHLNLKAATFIAAIVLGAVGVVGLAVGGWVCDHFGRRRRGGRLLVVAAAMLAATPLIYFALKQPPGATKIFMLLMGSGSLLMFVYYSGVYAAIADVVEPALRGTAMAIYFFAMYVLGASFGSYLTGLLSDHLARSAMARSGASAMTEQFKAEGLHQAMYLIPLLCLVLSLVLFAGAGSQRLKTEAESS